MESKVEARRRFIINVIYFTIIIVLIYLAGKYVISWLLPFVMGFAIAFLFKPIVRRVVRKTGLSTRLVGCVVILLVYALLGIILSFASMKIVSVLIQVFTSLPQFYRSSIHPTILELAAVVDSFIKDLAPDIAGESTVVVNSTLQRLQSSLYSISTRALGWLYSFSANVPTFVLAFFFTIVSSVLISMNYQQVANFLTKQVPENKRDLLFSIKNNMGGAITRYIRAYSIIMCVTFGELAAGLLILRVPYAIPIALGIAFFDILPVFGTGGIVIPWALIALLQKDFRMAIGLLVIYVVVLVVRNIVEPKIVGQSLGINPLVTLSAIYLGFKTMGVLGMIVMPIAVQIAISLHRAGVVKLWKT